uniref:lysosome-associated membrane glycoprotein 1 n=1 Tax=Myxine glutinosa TaxID=7769 RepID=UPI00358F3BE4
MAVFVRAVFCAIWLGFVFALATSEEPETGDYALNATGTGDTCLKANMALQLKLTYVVETKETAIFNIDPAKVTVSGVCGDTTTTLNLSFTNGNIMFTFSKENTISVIAAIDLKLKYTTAKSIVIPFKVRDTRNYRLAHLNESYKCNSAEELLTGENVTLIASHVQLQPFGVSNNTFLPASICSDDYISTTAKTTTTITTTTTASTNGTTTTASTNGTTTTAKTTTAPSTTTHPTPPKPEKGKYNVTDKDNQICLLAQMGVELVITSSDKKNSTAFDVNPSKVIATGGCEKNSSYVRLAYNQWNMTFYFKTSNKTFHFSRFDANFTTLFPGPIKGLNVSNTSLNLLSASLGKAYECLTTQDIPVWKNVLLKLSDLKLQPFLVKNGTFGEVEDCTLDKDSLLIPVIVGSVLVALIVIVLIAYLISRRRSYAGYQSI